MPISACVRLKILNLAFLCSEAFKKTIQCSVLRYTPKYVCLIDKLNKLQEKTWPFGETSICTGEKRRNDKNQALYRNYLFLYLKTNVRSVQLYPRVTAKYIYGKLINRVSEICRNYCTVLMPFIALFK